MTTFMILVTSAIVLATYWGKVMDLRDANPCKQVSVRVEDICRKVMGLNPDFSGKISI